MNSSDKPQIPLDKVQVRRWGTEGLMLVIPKGISQPRELKVGDWLQAFIDPDPASTRFSFEPTSPPEGNGIPIDPGKPPSSMNSGKTN